MGKIRTPFYRIVIADSRTKRDGRVIEEIGTYNPKAEPSIIKIDTERAQYWLGVGAQPTEAVAALLKITGDIGGKNTMKFAEEKRSKEEILQDALKDLNSEPKADEAKADDKAEDKADEPKSEPAAEEAKTQGDPVADAADEAKA